MIISIINHTDGEISDAEVQRVIRAINRQIQEDFEPYWSLGATLRLEGRSTKSPKTQTLADMRGDALIYLWNEVDVDGAIGYHDRNNRGIPYGFVFTQVAEDLHEPWSVTLSHEALELVADPEVNLLVQGPHPREDRTVFHWYEMCDAVQSETYEIDGVAVSNFVLPLYFTGEEERGGRNDFLGSLHDGETLQSFGINPGGYVGFFDPELGHHDTASNFGDQLAARRMEIKFKLKGGRRGLRYQRFDEGTELESDVAAAEVLAPASAARGVPERPKAPKHRTQARGKTPKRAKSRKRGKRQTGKGKKKARSGAGQ